jgi:hypothetical protein
MTLKCTAGADRHCHEAHFESPLSFRSIGAVDSELRPTDAPVDGWFCGPAVATVQQEDASDSKAASAALDPCHSSVSLTTTLGATIALSRPGLHLGPPVRPFTTLGVTITLFRPGQAPGPSPMPSPSADVASEDIACEDDAPGGKYCCFDEQDTSEPCYDEARRARRARLRPRQATGGSTTATPPVPAPEDAITRRSAAVCTAYIGNTNRAPLVEATRPWNIVVPTLVTTSTATAGPYPPRSPRKGRDRAWIVGVVYGAILAMSVIATLVYRVWRKWRPHLLPSPQHPSMQGPNGHELADHAEELSRRLRNYVKHTRDLQSVTDRAADVLGSVQPSPDDGYVLEEPGRVYTGPLGPFSARRQPASAPTSDAGGEGLQQSQTQSKVSLE